MGAERQTRRILPATFKGTREFSKAAEATWISRAGRPHRIGYVALPEMWLITVVDAHAGKRIVLSTMGAEDQSWRSG